MDKKQSVPSKIWQSFVHWLKFTALNLVDSYKYNKMKFAATFIFIPAILLGLFLNSHAVAMNRINESAEGVAKNIGIYLFALVLLGCINIFNAFALNSKKNLGTVILNTITTVLLLLFGFLYIFSFIDQTGKYQPNSSVYISIATVGISMACALAGCIISYFFIDKEYVKEVD